MGEEILTISACLSLLVDSTFLLGLLLEVFKVNLDTTICLNVLLQSSTFNKSYLALL